MATIILCVVTPPQSKTPHVAELDDQGNARMYNSHGKSRAIPLYQQNAQRDFTSYIKALLATGWILTLTMGL